MKWPYNLFPQEIETRIRNSRIESESKESLLSLRRIYSEGFKDHRKQKLNPTSRSNLLNYHFKWERSQQEDGTLSGGLYVEDIVGVALRKIDMRIRDSYLDKATLQFEYLFYKEGGLICTDREDGVVKQCILKGGLWNI